VAATSLLFDPCELTGTNSHEITATTSTAPTSAETRSTTDDLRAQSRNC
jgi:hypothetical protein